MDQKQLRELENRCIQECAPACTTACPIHVDVRGMLAEAGRGDFTAGLKVLRKTLPFPGIISRICDQPCRRDCRRGEVGDAIQVAAIERACVTWGEPGDPVAALPRKPRRIAVVGGGLSGLTVAYDLARKGYEVVIYEAAGHLGGQARGYPAELLPPAVIENDLAALPLLGIEVITNTPVGKIGKNGRLPPLSLLCDEYEAVYLGIGSGGSETYDLGLDEAGRIQVDPRTLMTSQAGVFAGGGLLRVTTNRFPQTASPEARETRPAEEQPGVLSAPPPMPSPILSILDGRRAATSIDRYLQHVSLTAARANEGPYTTRLYTSVQGIEPLPEVAITAPAQGYRREEAVQEALRCIQCECMECVKVCAYLEHYAGYPKKYVREIYNNLSIVMGTRYSNKLVNSCSLCGLCGEVCPEDLDMGAVCSEARQIMVQQKRMPPSAHDFALRDMAFSNGEKFALARSRPGRQASEYAFFPGCQLSASSPGYVEQVYAYLDEKLSGAQPNGVGLILRCCGAPADWAGRVDLFQASKTEFMAEYERMGRPRLVLACSSCYQVFKTHFPEVAMISLWEVMDQSGLPAGLRPGPGADRAPLAVHDPCATRYESRIQESARNILQRLGYAIRELPLSREKTECCSYGGLMWLAHPELAHEVVRRRVEESPDDYVTYCAMCRDFYVRQGKPTLHLLDLIYNADPDSTAQKVGPGYSQRHENRARLKRKLLKQIWGEDMEGSKAYEDIRLIIPPQVQEMLDQRLILFEDIQQVIEYAERSGKKLLNKKTGHFLAYHKPGAVTYWVEYSPQEDAYFVHKAYSHRMEIGEDAKR